MDHSTTEPTTPAINKTLLRRAFLLALIPAVVLAGRMAHSAEVAAKNAELWTIQIQPQKRSVALALQTQPSDEAPRPEAPNVPVPAADSDPFAPVPAEPAPMPPAAEEPANEWGIDVVPNGKFTLHGMTYRQVYDSIPYSRAEYLANPSYRHEATMELLTGTPRQTVIHRTYEPRLNESLAPQPEFLYNRYGGYGGGYGPSVGSGYGFGYSRPQYAPAFRYFLPINYGF